VSSIPLWRYWSSNDSDLSSAAFAAVTDLPVCASSSFP
jgi:hypothetical protein